MKLGFELQYDRFVKEATSSKYRWGMLETDSTVCSKSGESKHEDETVG